MKTYLLFAPAFLEWPLEIAREMERRFEGAQCGGLATGHRQIAQRVATARDVRISPLDYLDDLERAWLARAPAPGEMAKYEAMFGLEQLRRLVIADREIGYGYVSGGVVADTALVRLSRDPKNIERYVAGMLRHFLTTFENFRPNVVFCYTVASAPAFALAIVSEHFGIPFGRFNHTRLGKHLVIDDSPLDRLEPVRERFTAARDDSCLLRKRMPEARGYIEEFRRAATSPDYLAAHKRRVVAQMSLRRIARSTLAAIRTQFRLAFRQMDLPLRRAMPTRYPGHVLTTALRVRQIRRRRIFAAPHARPDAAFVFYPLHVDPEAATMVLAPMHTDQIAVVEALSKSLPLAMRLVVKEHEPMLGRRPAGFYERLARIPGVFLASPSDSGTALVREAALTATITGTAGWEAMLLHKPALLIGNPPYTMVQQGFVQCADLSSLPTAVQAALSVKPASDDILALYIAAALDVSFSSGTDVIWSKVTEETVRANPEFLHEVTSRLVALAEFRRTGNNASATMEPKVETIATGS